MSEFVDIRDHRAIIHRQLMATVSAIALTTYIVSSCAAEAEDNDGPTVWIELGGQAEMIQGVTSPFTAPFMSPVTTPDVYQGASFDGDQRPARFAVGIEGALTVQPKDSDWKFSAGIRYGRSHAQRHKHKQTPAAPVPYNITADFYYYGNHYHYTYVGTKVFNSSALADTQTKIAQSYLILDFQAGKDVGLGLFGHGGTSTINAGVRVASFSVHSTTLISGRPEIHAHDEHVPYLGGLFSKTVIRPTFYQYTLSASAARSFRGVGPSLSWNASADLIGSEDRGELSFDWGLNAAMLFGKQKAKTDHTTLAYHQTFNFSYAPVYHYSHHSTRSHSTIVPNLGGFAGFSVKYPTVQVSLGYRADFFFGAMDAGIDVRSTQDVGFHGPFATVTIGLGG